MVFFIIIFYQFYQDVGMRTYNDCKPYIFLLAIA